MGVKSTETITREEAISFIKDRASKVEDLSNSQLGDLLEYMDDAILEGYNYSNYEVIENEEVWDSDEWIGDGFGNKWNVICPTCKKKSMHVVRPGKAQCGFCG